MKQFQQSSRKSAAGQAGHKEGMQRIETLDFFRGVLAIGVMGFHYMVWAGIGADTTRVSSFLTYGVTFFYILSGASLAYVYRERIHGGWDIGRFYVKRLFRVMPLYAVAVTLAIGVQLAEHLIKGSALQLDEYRIFLNYSMLFGFLDPTAYMVQGGWAIGNEIVFYSICPVLLLIATYSRGGILVAFLTALLLAWWFACVRFDRELPLNLQWRNYINPLNHLIFFVGGMVIGIFQKRPSHLPNALVLTVFIAAALIFIFLPVPGGTIQAVTGYHRIVFTTASFALIWALFVYAGELSGVARKMGNFIGAACYSVFLLHPFVAIALVYAAKKIGIGLGPALVTSFMCTLVLGYFSFRYFELPMMQLGSKVGLRMRPKSRVGA